VRPAPHVKRWAKPALPSLAPPPAAAEETDESRAEEEKRPGRRDGPERQGTPFSVMEKIREAPSGSKVAMNPWKPSGAVGWWSSIAQLAGSPLMVKVTAKRFPGSASSVQAKVKVAKSGPLDEDRRAVYHIPEHAEEGSRPGVPEDGNEGVERSRDWRSCAPGGRG